MSSDNDTTTINLKAEVRNGQPVYENVLVTKIQNNAFRLVRSPGLVPGIAAGDEFELNPREPHGFRLLKRGGNVCVQLFLTNNVAQCRQNVVPLVEQLGGRLDGETAGATTHMLVFTIPVAVGFPPIERLMAKAVAISPGCEWYYGNVYEVDGKTPLNWWA